MSMTFADYCWSFYAPGEIYGDLFGNTLTREELNAAIATAISTPFAIPFVSIGGELDSIDREHVRDIMLANREVRA